MFTSLPCLVYQEMPSFFKNKVIALINYFIGHIIQCVGSSSLTRGQTCNHWTSREVLETPSFCILIFFRLRVHSSFWWWLRSILGPSLSPWFQLGNLHWRGMDRKGWSTHFQWNNPCLPGDLFSTDDLLWENNLSSRKTELCYLAYPPHPHPKSLCLLALGNWLPFSESPVGTVEIRSCFKGYWDPWVWDDAIRTSQKA